MMFWTPAFMRIFEQATPEAPTPLTTTFRFSIFSPVIFRRVEQRGEHHDRGAVLVVVEDRDVEHLLEAVLHLEAHRRGDVLEVDAAPGRARSRRSS